MKMNIKHNKILTAAILFLFLWANYNVCFNLHYHIGEYGHIILHAHPFQKDNDKNQQLPNHIHTHNEFILLDILFITFSFILLFIVLILFVFEHTHFFPTDPPYTLILFIQNGLTIRSPPLVPIPQSLFY